LKHLARLLAVVPLIALTFVLSPIPSAAQSTDTEAAPPDLGAMAALAAYVPHDALAFGAIRADAGYIETLSGIFASALDALPEGALPAQPTLTQLLDMATVQLFGVDFVNGVRPWLGDAAGFAVGRLDAQIDENFSNDNETPLALYFQVADRAAAEAFVDDFVSRRFAAGAMERADEAGYRLYRPTVDTLSAFILLRDDLLVIAGVESMLPLDGPPANSLATNPYFVETTALLPADSYNVFAYVDLPTLLSYSYADSYFPTQAERLLLALTLRTFGPLAAGATILEGEGAPIMTLDAALGAGNLSGITALGFQFAEPAQADPDFLANVPANAALAVHSVNPLVGFDLLIDNYAVLEPFIYPLLVEQLYDNGFGSVALANSLGAYNVFARYVERLPDIISANAFGLDYETEVRNWLGGDVAFFVSFNDQIDPAGINPALQAIEWGFVGAAADGPTSRAAMATLRRDLPNTLRTLGATTVRFAEETVGTADALAMTFDLEPFEPGQALYTVLIAADEARFAFGSRAAVTTIFQGEAAVRPFADVARAELTPSSGGWYIDGPQIIRLFDLALFGVRGPQRLEEAPVEAQIARALLLWVGQGVISFNATDDGAFVLRAAQHLTPTDELPALREQFAPVTAGAGGVGALPAPLTQFAPPSARLDDGGFALGDPDAPVTVLLFFDYFCPPCQSYHTETVLPLIDQYVVTGQARLEMRFLPTAGGERLNQIGAYAECIDETVNGLFWPFSNFAYAQAEAGSLDVEAVRRFMADQGVDEAAVADCLTTADQVTVDEAFARQLGATATPTVYLRYAVDGDPAPLPDSTNRNLDALGALIEAAQ
jgi:protein-disulfide isomerase